ncbi:MAG: PAC2 family protein [Syntrophorhabdaceae bacterium]|nr:PAC2 family protein [Syntrophorhabdaceae bacterium]
MKIGAFNIWDFIPDEKDIYVFASLRPWIDVNGVGTMILQELEGRFKARKIGELARPGLFYDFTRYRPIIHLEEGIRDLTIPNTEIFFAKRDGEPDFLFLHLLEPHAFSELYVRSVLKILSILNVKRYILLGSMYDTVPHTKPLIVNGYGLGEEAILDAKRACAMPITYHGPSTIIHLITKGAEEMGIEANVFIVSLPQYIVLEEDYMGKMRLMEILNLLYNIPLDTEGYEKALEQREMINKKLEASPEVRMLLPQLEAAYDMRVKMMDMEGMNHLTTDIEEHFWKSMGKDIGKA